MVMDEGNLRTRVISEFHDTPSGGHSGFEKTVQRKRTNVYWKGWLKDVKQFLKECDKCQRNKYDNLFPAGLLQPLLIPK